MRVGLPIVVFVLVFVFVRVVGAELVVPFLRNVARRLGRGASDAARNDSLNRHSSRMNHLTRSRPGGATQHRLANLVSKIFTSNV